MDESGLGSVRMLCPWSQSARHWVLGTPGCTYECVQGSPPHTLKGWPRTAASGPPSALTSWLPSSGQQGTGSHTVSLGARPDVCMSDPKAS